MIKKEISFFLVILILIAPVSATKLYGTIYDLGLLEAKNAIVRVNSVPEQVYVSKSGTYEFQLNPGTYILNVTYADENLKYVASEEVIITEEGDFIYDIILFPDLSEEEELFEEDEKLELSEFSENRVLIWPWIMGGIVTGIAVVLLKKKKKPVKTDLDIELSDKVLEFIKKEGGRVTQKEIRKKFPVSEAKISLVVSELENDGKLSKIKKSKGNIIILK